MKKLLKWTGIIVGIYVVFVLIFETVYLGHFQPSFEYRHDDDVDADDDAGPPQ